MLPYFVFYYGDSLVKKKVGEIFIYIGLVFFFVICE